MRQSSIGAFDVEETMSVVVERVVPGVPEMVAEVASMVMMPIRTVGLSAKRKAWEDRERGQCKLLHLRFLD